LAVRKIPGIAGSAGGEVSHRSRLLFNTPWQAARFDRRFLKSLAKIPFVIML